jgi:hypothetical protein
MMETLCLRNEPKRYIVSIGNKVLIVTYDYFVAKRIEEEIVARKITDETFSVVVGVRK